ncbi:MAG TPA: hypothetical protein V6C58_16765 [Allocoleopsis sp.]
MKNKIVSVVAMACTGVISFTTVAQAQNCQGIVRHISNSCYYGNRRACHGMNTITRLMNSLTPVGRSCLMGNNNICGQLGQLCAQQRQINGDGRACVELSRVGYVDTIIRDIASRI